MKTKAAVCILTSQYFDWGIYGGFGSMSRKLAESLARDGFRVSVIVPGRQGQAAGGHRRRRSSSSARNIIEACRVIRESPDADIFHSKIRLS
ncbi:MAG: glycogen/starch synthase [Nitrospiraceae bacterium]